MSARPALMRLHLYARAILVKNLKSLICTYKLQILKKKKKIFFCQKSVDKLNKIQVFEK